MFRFKERDYAIPAVIGGALSALGSGSAIAGGVSLGMQGLGMAQQGIQARKAAKQADKQMIEQRQLQNKQLKAQAKQNQQMMNTLKQVAKENPSVAAAAAGQQMGIMQQQFAISADSVSKFAKTAKGSLKDLAIVGKNMGAHKKLATGLAMGATAAGASYLVDKAIQADAKRSGIDLGKTEDDRKKHRKRIGKVAALAGGTTLAVLGAKKGVLGKSVQNTANKYLTKDNASKVGKTVKNAFAERFYDPKKMAAATTLKDKVKAVNGVELGLTAGFAAMPAIGYISNKKAMKEQEEATERQKEYANTAALANLGKTATRFGKTVKESAGKVIKRIEPMIKKAGISGEKAKQAASKNVATFKEAPVRNILGKVSSFMGGGGQEGTAKFTEELAKQAKKSGNKGTAKAAEFLGKHKTLAVGGSIAVGSMMFKPFGLGEKAVQSATGAVDKNSMRYEKSQNKTVEEE